MTTDTPSDSKGSGAANPFIGLRPFDIDDADRFFGRNTQTYELLRRLHTLHFVAVLGPSGCGKSSLIRAGVLAALRNGYLAEDGDWRIAMLEPGADPLAAWTRHLTPYLKPGRTTDDLLEDPATTLDTTHGPLVILVDQFEDLFRYGSRFNKATEVGRFVRAMLATGQRDARIFLILTMRSEYLPHCAAYADLAGAINEGLYLVPRMTREQMRQAIVGQVRAGGGAITTELVEQLLDDAASEDDGLPVLQHALAQIWPLRERWEPLGLALYPKEGGLASFVDHHAERVYAALEQPELQHAAESLFRAITEVTADGRAARRPLPFDEIVGQTGEPADRLNTVIEAFRREGFLSVKEEASRTIDIAHEAVARQWKRLGQHYIVIAGDRKFRTEGWMLAEARKRHAVDALRNVCDEWARSDRNSAYLFRGVRLRRLMTDLGDQRVSESEQAFLDASRRNDRWDRALSPASLAKALLFLIVAVAAALGVRQFQRVSRTAEDATHTAQVALSLANAADTENLKAQTAYLQAKEPAQTATGPGISGSSAPAKAHLYTQIWNDEQARLITPVLAKLPKDEVIVARFETVTVGPNRDELRYFRLADLDEAQRLAALLNENGLNLRLSYVKGFEDSSKISPRHYEMWLAAPGPPTGQAPPDLAPPGTTRVGSGGPLSVLGSRLQMPRIDSVTVPRPDENYGRLSLRIMGQWLDADAQVQIDGKAIERNGIVVSVLAPSSSARFATDINITLNGVNIDPARPHSVTLTTPGGPSVTASFQVGHTLAGAKARQQ